MRIVGGLHIKLSSIGMLACLACVLLTLAGCSARKNTAATRNYQAFITRYNIHYNGDTHYKETLHEMETKYEDDFTRLLYVHPAEARGEEKVPQPQGNFDRSIEKAQKAIQLRSIKKKPAKKAGRSSDPAYKAWMKRDEYNPFLHNSWMMMARSQFMNGDFSGAAATFFYISKHFTWLPATVTEARLWQARCYCAMGWLFEAEMIITRVKTDQLTDKNLKSLYYSTYSDLLIRSGEYARAIPYLQEAASLAGGSQKVRLNFLLGQVSALAGDKALAYKAFGKAGSSSGAPYRTKFNARIKQSEVYDGKDFESEVKALRNMTRYDRNKEYLDQVYYAIGNLYLSHGDTLKAIENYKLAAEKSTRGGIDKAIDLVTLGGLYYDRHQYDLAQPCYSEGVPLLPETYPDYKMLKRRSDVLDELAVYSQNVTLQDSLLRLSYMTPEQQLKVVEKIIDELKKKEKEAAEEAAREEFMANQPGTGITNDKAPTTFTMNTDGSWYFYNQSTVQAGKTEFQRRWGNRKLEDDWRRRNKAAFSFDDINGPADGDTNEEGAGDDENSGGEADGTTPRDEEAANRANDPHYPEYYLKQIPKDSLARLTSHDVIQEGLYYMGVILKDKMEDYGAARDAFNRLLDSYPDNVYRLDALYNLYLMAVRANDAAQAEIYRQAILRDFPDSPQGVALLDPDYIEKLRTIDEKTGKLYEQTFQAYVDNDNAAVHRAYETMSREYSMSDLMPKFMFLHALAYVTDKQPDMFRNVLNEMLERYPEADVATYASAWLKGLSQGRQLQAGVGGNLRGMFWDTRLGNDSIATGEDTALEFELNPDDRQLLVLLYPVDRISHNQLLYDIARHNFNTYSIKDFDLEQMNFGQLGLLIVKGFDNLAEINHYRSLMQQNPDLSIPRGVYPVVISEKNFETLLKNGASFEQYFEFARDKTYRDTEESVLDPEIFGESEGIPEESVETAGEDVSGGNIEPVAPPAMKPDTKAQSGKSDKSGRSNGAKEPARKKQPELPEYPSGSEDDPLLD